jgi:hypothetical protein
MNPGFQLSDELSAHLQACEQSLLDAAVRRDRTRVSGLLSKDFEEFGASGRVWSREQILELLATEDFDPPTMEDFKCHQLAEGIALVTYRTVPTEASPGQSSAALRSSIWIKEAREWRVRFHQGTRAS